jgi:3-dehydroquinate dehydratase-2
VDIPFVEVHLSNIFSRGGWHAQSVFTDRAVGQIAGFKGYSYECGLRALFNHINTTNRKKEEEK